MIKALLQCNNINKPLNIPLRVHTITGNVTKILRRTTHGDEIAPHVDIASNLVAHIDAHDLTEALGAVAENALRHAHQQVVIRVQAQGKGIDLSIEDGGRRTRRPAERIKPQLTTTN